MRYTERKRRSGLLVRQEVELQGLVRDVGGDRGRVGSEAGRCGTWVSAQAKPARWDWPGAFERTGQYYSYSSMHEPCGFRPRGWADRVTGGGETVTELVLRVRHRASGAAEMKAADESVAPSDTAPVPNPAAVYLDRLHPSGRRSMRRELNRAVAIFTDETVKDATAFDWSQIDRQASRWWDQGPVYQDQQGQEQPAPTRRRS